MKSTLIKCEKCGKTLIERLPNGLFRFVFGKSSVGTPIVNMVINGSIKMRCLRKSCTHPNILNFFPFDQQSPVERTESVAGIVSEE